MLHSYFENSLLGGKGSTGTQSSSSARYFLFSGTKSLVAIAQCLSICFWTSLLPLSKSQVIGINSRVERVLVFQSVSE